MSGLEEKWKDAISNKSSEFSLTGENGNKTKVEKKGFEFKKALGAAWMALTIATVAVAGVTFNEWVNRVDNITAGIKSGQIDTTKEAVDVQFYVERGANFQDSFIGVKDRITDKIKDALGIEKETPKVSENNSLAKNLISFVNSDKEKNNKDNTKKLKI